MNTNIVIIEDDVQLNLVITEYFKKKSWNTSSIYDCLDAIDFIDNKSNQNINLYVIDINIPSCSGIEIIKHIRKVDLETPIIIITASLDIQHFVDAFEYGCNEYIKKPFHLEELDIRVKNLLKHTQDNIFFNEEFYFNQNLKCFYMKGKEITLRNKEKRLIELLLMNANKIVPLEVVYDYVWEGEIRETYPIRQLLADIRKKLPIDIIKTKIKQGYVIEV